MKRTALIAVTVVALVFGLVAYATAANPETVVVTATVPSVFTMSVSTNAVSFPLTNANLETDVAASTPVVVTLKSNKIVSLAYTMTDFTAAGPLMMPMSVMKFSAAGDATVASTTAAASGTISANIARGNRTITNSYTIQPGVTYEPATYTSNLVYTATQL